jgi:uncharacterized protein YigA (DUF484 family)
VELESSMSAEQVELFLISHPDFFVGRDRLIKRMTLPHASGTAISLLERQNILLRTQTERLQSRLNDLIDNARINDRMFNHLQKTILEAVMCQSPVELGRVLQDNLCDYFNVDELRIFLDEDAQDEFGLVLHASALEPLKMLSEKLERSRVYCGSLPKVELQHLFGNDVAIGSVAVARSVSEGRQVTLCLGSNDPDYYRNSMDTLFLNYLADITAHLQVAMAHRTA